MVLDSGFQSPGFRIPRAKNSWIPESGFPYMGRDPSCVLSLFSSTWIVAVAVSSPYFFTTKLVENSGRIHRDVNAGLKEAFGETSSYPDFKLVTCILFIYIPLLLLVILYSFIFIKLKAQVNPGEHSSNIGQQRQRRNRNVLHMSIAIISVFVFCWLPYTTNELIFVYRSSSTHFSCSFWLYYHVTFYMRV